MARFIVPSGGTGETQPGIPVESVSASPPAKAPSAPPKKSAPAPVKDEPEEVDVEEVEERPRRKKRDEDESDGEDERPRRKKRDDTDDADDDDRPRRKRRNDDDDDEDDDDDDRPRRRKKKKSRASGGSKSPMVFVIAGVCAVLLLCCVGGGVAVWLGGRTGNQGGTTVVFGPDNTFRSSGALRIWDPTKDRRHYRLYTVQMEAGKTYEIDMSSKDLDSYLVLLDENNQVLIEHDDVDLGRGNLNARIVFTAPRAGLFRIEASTFSDHETGNYSLVVRRR